jgi:ribA/ribD-fused uncharacterized protein
MIIKRFRGKYSFLSNFYPADVVFEGVSYPTVEHAFQAAKTFLLHEREEIRNTTDPFLAKGLGRRVLLRADWDEVRLSLMEILLRQKFAPHTFLAKRLLETGDALLVEENTWGDRFWGVCNGNGQNMLGRILMEIRKDLRVDL